MCAAASAGAQQQADAGPYGNLFKGSGGPQNQSLDLSGGLFGGYDDTPLAQAPNGTGDGLIDPRFQKPGVTSGFNSTASYRYGHSGRGRSGSRAGFGATASVQEFSGGSSNPVWVPNYGANTSFGTNLTPKIAFAASGSVAYAPFYRYAPFLTVAPAESRPAVTPAIDGVAFDSGTTPDAPEAPPSQTPTQISPVGTDLGFATESQYVTQMSTGVSLTDRFTKRSSISASAGLDEVAMSDSRIETQSGGLQISHNLTRKVGVHVGYRLQSARFIQASSPSTKSQSHAIDIGIDYGDGASFTFARYYTFSFTTGVSAVRQGGDNHLQFRLDGSATLVRRIGRTWAASIGAGRGTAYVLGFDQPLFTDSANAGFGGQLAPRLNFSAGGAYVVGQRPFSGGGDNLVSKSASTKLAFGVTRHVGVYGQLSYYEYNVPDGFFTTLAFPTQQHRRSASVGLSFWVPLIHQRIARQP